MLVGMTKDKKQRNNEDMKWKTLSSKQLIDRPWMRVRCDKVQLPDGRVHEEYYVLSYPSWVNVIAETEEGDIILERQYRHGLDIVSTEICAGVMEEGETPLEAAQRELEEETGYTGGEWKEIMTVAPNPGVMDNLCHCFYAKKVRKTCEQHLDDTEDIDVLLCPKQEVKQMLIRGEFIQALMVAPLWKFFSTEF
jgi:hydrolase, NUDIX family